MKLQLGDRIIEAKGGYRLKGSKEGAEKAAVNGGQGFWRFNLKVTKSELEKIQQHIDSKLDLTSSANCVTGSCDAVTLNSAVNIPAPFSKVPSLAALYMTVTNRLGYTRIASVEFVGKSKLSSFASVGLALEYAVPAGGAFLGYVIIEAAKNEAKKDTIVVPVQESSVH